MLDSHFVTGDGRGNENIALTAVHSVFHSEHNRVLEDNKVTILASGDRAFINEWLLVDLADADPIPTDVDDVIWDGDRMFQAARFSTEMQYQHMVFEEFARRIQPASIPSSSPTRRHRRLDPRRVRPCGLPLRPLDAELVGRPSGQRSGHHQRRTPSRSA